MPSISAVRQLKRLEDLDVNTVNNNLLIDIWEWDRLLMPNALGRKGCSFIQLMMDITHDRRHKTPWIPQDWSSSPSSNAWRFNSCTSVFLESEICSWYEVSMILEAAPQSFLHSLMQVQPCACPWKGFMQTSYQSTPQHLLPPKENIQSLLPPLSLTLIQHLHQHGHWVTMRIGLTRKLYMPLIKF